MTASRLSAGVRIAVAVALAVLALGAGAPGQAQAQTAPSVPQAAPAQAAPGVTQAQPGQNPPFVHAPRAKDVAAPALTRSTGTAIFFWLVALGMVAGSIFVITRKNLITAVMGMVGTFFAIAAVYAMLYAHFLTAIQVLVYAGAIMVLFVFVIMILNKPEAEPWSTTGVAGKIVTVGVLAYFLIRLVQVLWGISPAPETLTAPGPITIMAADGPQAVDFGSTKAMGNTLFRDYLFPFEAVSLVLLIAVVGAVAVARPHERRPTTMPEDGGASEA